MFKLRNINPMVRAVGTMAAVAAVAGGITFATLTSNVVALTPNQLTTSTASLAIGPNCPASGTSMTGLQDSNFAPGSSTSVAFCLTNTGGVPMTVGVSIPQNLTADTAAQATTLNITCSSEGSLSTTLSAWSNGASYSFSVPLGVGSSDGCTATASLDGNYASNGDTIPAFSIDFTGTQSNA